MKKKLILEFLFLNLVFKGYIYGYIFSGLLFLLGRFVLFILNI